jgi:ABC-type dipeptide/oligopeptide/nickel transport system permease subunit
MESQVTDWGASLMASLTSAMSLFFAAIPRLFGFIVIVIVGWIVSALLAKAIAMLLRKAHFNQLDERSGFADFVGKTGTETDSAGMIASIAKWFVRLIVLVVAFDALGLPAVSEVLRDLLLWLPNLAVALVVLVIGGIAANAVSKLVRGMTAEADLDNPDFAAMARAMGIHARRVEDPGELPAAIEDILSHNGPALLDVVTAKQELSMPPTIKLEQIKGFSLWALRAVMNGRGDEVIEIAKTNLLPR